jgi:hypothetical protein
MKIFCCNCKVEVDARLTNGKEIYPHRSDLFQLPFWKCDCCNNYIGCHHKTKNKTKPLGYIPSPEIKNARIHIHALLDPIWKNNRISRKKLYCLISENLGYIFHTGEIKTIDEARRVYKIVLDISKKTKQQKRINNV